MVGSARSDMDYAIHASADATDNCELSFPLYESRVTRPEPCKFLFRARHSLANDTLAQHEAMGRRSVY